jgi:hypothetical protein
MSKIVRVQTGDYRIITAPGGTITLDSGSASIVEPPGWPGGVIINGDLLVNGVTTTIDSATLSVKDNIIDINVGETGNGVTLNTSGIQIDRGNAPDVSFLWDERIGAFVLVDANYLTPANDLHESALALGARSILTGGSNLTLVGSNLGSAGVEEGVVDVIGTVDYERKILDYDLLNSFFEIVQVSRMGGTVTITTDTPHNLITNDYIYVNCFPFSQINTGTDPVIVTRISDNVITYVKLGSDIPEQIFSVGFAGTIRPVSVINDDFIPNMKAVVDYTSTAITGLTLNKIVQGDSRVIVTDNGIPDQYGNPQPSEIRFDINGNNQAYINSNGLHVDNIQIDNNTIKNKTAVDRISFDSVMSLKTKTLDQPQHSGYVSLYAKPAPGTGGTGLFFVNTSGPPDELISKTKAFLYSLIL